MASKISGFFFLILGIASLAFAMRFLLDLVCLLFGLWCINRAMRLLHRPNLYQYSSRMFFDFKRNNF
jgi:hypothetical protein